MDDQTDEQFADEQSVLSSIYDTDYTRKPAISRHALPSHCTQTPPDHAVPRQESQDELLTVIDITISQQPHITVRYYAPSTYPFKSSTYYTLLLTVPHSHTVIDLCEDAQTALQVGLDAEYVCKQVDEIRHRNRGHVHLYDVTDWLKEYVNNRAIVYVSPSADSEGDNDAKANTDAQTDNNHHNTKPQRQVKHYDIFTGAAVTEKHSTFQGHCCDIQSVSDVDGVMEQLQQNNKIARATHNMYAYSVMDGDELISGCSDDGETGAGRVIMELMQRLGCVNVVAVVTRWYGGIQLGSLRFALIKQVSNQTLHQFNFVPAVK